MSRILGKIENLVKEADSILIGAGSGLSTAAGVKMDGEGFEKNFEPWIKKYGFKDLYTSSFYQFKTSEEKWAYWGKYIKYIDIDMPGTELYKKIYKLIQDKNYFVVTTNVDDQFYKTGFDKDKIFRTQGSYRLLQCSISCHNKLYDAEETCNELIANTSEDLKVPSNLIPHCPVCGEEMDINLRKDDTFVQDELWYKQCKKYENFLKENTNKKLLLLEFGVGFNTPGIIRFPFEQLTAQNKNWILVRFNKDTKKFYDIEDNKFIEVKEDINKVFE